MKLNYYKDIEQEERSLQNKKMRYLEQNGWCYTCEVASVWLWSKKINGKTLYVGLDTAVFIQRMND